MGLGAKAAEKRESEVSQCTSVEGKSIESVDVQIGTHH